MNMVFSGIGLQELLLLMFAAPILSALVSGFASKHRLLASSSIFLVSIVGTLASIDLIKIFLEEGHNFINLTFFNIIHFNIEPINLLFAAMVLCLWSATNLYSISYLNLNIEIVPGKFFLFLSLSIFFTLCVAFASNLISIFVGYELLTLSTYPLVAHLGKEEERKSAKIYLNVLMISSLLLFLPAIVFLNYLIGTTEFAIGGIMQDISFGSVTILFMMFLYGVAKSAIVPVHFWLPRAMVASFPVSAVLHAVAVVKSGIFIMIKISVYIFGLEYLKSNILSIFDTNIITVLCGVSLIVSSVLALSQTKIKMILAYSTINQLSICLLAVSMFHPLAIKAAILHMISHAFGKITLFFASGYVYCHSSISEIRDFKGLGRKMKLIMAIFTTAALSIIGIPIFAGFISKAYVYYAALSPSTSYFVLCILTVSVLFTAHYFIKIIYKIYETNNKLSYGREKIYEYNLFSTMTFATILTFLGVVFYFLIYQYIVQLVDLIRYSV
jgi:multicomponent Na+:H+ antiporter subunit D